MSSSPITSKQYAALPPEVRAVALTIIDLYEHWIAELEVESNVSNRLPAIRRSRQAANFHARDRRPTADIGSPVGRPARARKARVGASSGEAMPNRRHAQAGRLLPLTGANRMSTRARPASSRVRTAGNCLTLH